MSVGNDTSADVGPEVVEEELELEANRDRERPHRSEMHRSRLLIGHFEAGLIGEDAQPASLFDEIFDRAQLLSALNAIGQDDSRR